MASFKVFRVVTLTISTPHSFVLGTTSTAATRLATDIGSGVAFQNQSTGATNVWVGSSTMVISVGATSTNGPGGVLIAQNGTYQVGPIESPSAVQMFEYYVASTSSNAVCAAHLVKMV